MTDGALADYVLPLLLQYFRVGSTPTLGDQITLRTYQLDLVRMHWAISPIVGDLCDYIEQHRHEALASLHEVEATDDAVIKGRLDARATVVLRLRTGHPTQVVYRLAERGYQTGPNRVLRWTILRAYTLARQLAARAPASSSYGAAATGMLAKLSRVRRLEHVSNAEYASQRQGRPSAADLTQAARARRTLYQNAYRAYMALAAVESGKREVIRNVLRETVVAPLEHWRIFELALALGMAEALETHLGISAEIRDLVPGQSVVIDVGPFVVSWQTRGAKWTDPPKEPSEIRLQKVLNAYGIDEGIDRPDILVSERSTGAALAVGEAKFFVDEEEGWRGGTRVAAAQVIRYSRGLADAADIDPLIARSVIGLWHLPAGAVTDPHPAGAPALAGFEDLKSGMLLAWAKRALNQLE